MQERSLAGAVEGLAFAAGKMAFVAGPRQVGKTTLSRMLLARRPGGRYCSWDDVEMRRQWARDPKQLVPESESRPLVVFDEIHKGKLWKRALKGVYDTLERPADILVTGSARLNVYRRGSDSLMGRYYLLRMHPFSVGELREAVAPSPDDALRGILHRELPPADAEAWRGLQEFGGFPEPFLAQSAARARLWRRGRLEKVIREDLRDLSRIPDLSRIEMLAALLPERVASPVSVATLREDLEVSHHTVTRWLLSLADLYYLFEVKPYTQSIRRSLRKEGKIYLRDWSEVKAPGPRFENAVAAHLLKACDTWTDTGEGDFALFYLRDKEKRELDFLVLRDGAPWLAVEAKVSETTPSRAWRHFLPQVSVPLAIQVVQQPGVWQWHGAAGAAQTRLLVASAGDVLGYLP